MPHYNEFFTEKTTKKQQQQKSKNKNFTAKIQHLNLKAPCIKVKLQSDKTLTTQFYFFLTIHQIEFSLTRIGNKSTKRRNNEAKFKKQSTFFKTINFKSEKSFAYNEIILDRFTKKSLWNQWDLSLVRLSQSNGIKMQKNSKNSNNWWKHKFLNH